MKPYVIGVDTGNKQVKTASQIFTSGIRSFDTAQAVFQDSNVICYKGRCYMLVSDRNSYKRDKTIDDDYFVLSLFAVAKELDARGVDIFDRENVPHIVLVVGLPPAHFSKQRDSFANYFDRGRVDFSFNDASAAICIDKVYVMVQGYAAIFNSYGEIRSYEDAYIIDIGGYTTDVIGVQNGKTNPSVCFSEDAGMIHLINDIRDRINTQFDSVPKENQIERLLYDTSYGDAQLESGMKAIAISTAQEYVRNILLRLREKGVDLRISKGIFTGGGAVRLKSVIEASEFVKAPLFIDNVRANAIGYETIVKYKLRQKT